MLKEQFLLPEDKVYMCGHSLGPCFKNLPEALNGTLTMYAKQGVLSWETDWIKLSAQVSESLAALIGAKSNEVVVTDSTSINLYRVLKACLAMKPKRQKILTTQDNFPADLYIADGVAEVVMVPEHQLIDHLDESICVLMLTHVNYRSSAVIDCETINQKAHQYGIFTVWDLSHSVGIVPLDMASSGIDFAVGCTYKYLSGGPGSPAFIYAYEKHHASMQTPIQGWMGHQKPFEFDADYQSKGIKQFLGGTPPIFSLQALATALGHFDAGLIVRLYEQAKVYTETLSQTLMSLELEVLEADRRGGHIAFCHPNGYGISQAMIANGVICDYRAPNLVRLCVNPLYLTTQDLDACIHHLVAILYHKYYLHAKFNTRKEVT
ncbi:MAG: aminotransferase class V-fold PLP-dependent enzyme [Gammaproteobacteria bacterium]|nr:aminotransferase class V-fold PLP-dependent enzyme [Gammaproteobacteria bacterium]